MRRRLEITEGDVSWAQQDWPRVVAHYEAALVGIDRPAPAIWVAIANVYMLKLKQYDQALAVALSGLKSSPKDEDLRATAGILYLFFIPPYSDYERAIAVMRPDVGFRNWYYANIAAGAYLGLGQFASAGRLAEEAVHLNVTRDVNLATSLRLLGIAERCAGNDASGIAHLRQANALSPGDVAAKVALVADPQTLCRADGRPH